MSGEKVLVDADLWEWLRDSAHHDDGCNGEYRNPEGDPDGPWQFRCRCGFRDIAPRLDDAAVPVEPVSFHAHDSVLGLCVDVETETDSDSDYWRKVTR